MNKKSLTQSLLRVAAFSLVTASAFAQQTEYVVPDAGFVSTKTRAEVIEELARAKADGSYDRLHQEFARPDEGFGSTKTRAEVLAPQSHSSFIKVPTPQNKARHIPFSLVNPQNAPL